MPYAETDGVRMYYEVDGSGEPLILHPGFVGCLEDWDDKGYVSALSGQYALIRLDPRGQGRSDKPLDPSAYATRQRVSDVLAVLDAEGIYRAHFWGYSMRAGIGIALGVASPGRLLSLVLGAPSPFHDSTGSPESDGMLIHLRAGMEELVGKWEAAFSDFWLSGRERYRWLMADADALAAAREQRLKEPYASENDLVRIPIPTFLYVGSGDSHSVLEAAKGAARLIPNAELLVLDRLGHAETLARIDRVLPPVLAFLEAVGSTP